MAEGGFEFGYDDPELDNNLDNDDDDDEEEEEVNRRQPYQPGAASSPYHGGETMEMETMHHEQSGLPDTSYEETPLLSDFLTPEDQEISLESGKQKILDRFPKADFKKLPPIGFSKEGARSEIVAFKAGKEERIFFRKAGSDGKRGILKAFTTKYSKALGPPAEEIIAEDRDTIRDQRKRLLEAEKELEQAQTLTAKREQEEKKMQELRQKTESTQARIDAIQDEQGSNLESEAELRRLIQLKKNYQTELENKKKELASLSKQAKSREKEQAKVDSLRASLAAKEREKNEMEERLNSSKALDDLKEHESELQRQNAEDQAIIQDENASPSDIEAARERVEERNEELTRLQTQIEERERARPLLERIKEIFKKYGVTLTAIVLAAGVTIGVVVSSITKGLKATGKALGKGLKDIGAKLASLLPGLIGSIVSFLFKAAGQAIGFLAEHTWLLILAVVVFLVEKYLKKRR